MVDTQYCPHVDILKNIHGYFVCRRCGFSEEDSLLRAKITALTAQLEETKENQRIAIEALEGYHNAFKNLILTPDDLLIPIRKQAEQAIVAIKGK